MESHVKRLLITLLLVAPTFTFAAEQVAIGGIGVSSCGQFLEDQQDPGMTNMHVTWAQGFLSGLNIADGRSGKELVSLPDDSTIKLYLVSHCTKKPLERPIGGALALYQELRARQSKASRP